MSSAAIEPCLLCIFQSQRQPQLGKNDPNLTSVRRVFSLRCQRLLPPKSPILGNFEPAENFREVAEAYRNLRVPYAL